LEEEREYGTIVGTQRTNHKLWAVEKGENLRTPGPGMQEEKKKKARKPNRNVFCLAQKKTQKKKGKIWGKFVVVLKNLFPQKKRSGGEMRPSNDEADRNRGKSASSTLGVLEGGGRARHVKR